LVLSGAEAITDGALGDERFGFVEFFDFGFQELALFFYYSERDFRREPEQCFDAGFAGICREVFALGLYFLPFGGELLYFFIQLATVKDGVDEVASAGEGDSGG